MSWLSAAFPHIAIDCEGVQPGSQTIERCHADLEQVYYVLDQRGVLVADGAEREIREGDMIHLPAGTRYQIRNPHATWLRYLIMAV